MFEKKFPVEKAKYGLTLDAVRNFAKKRGYHLEEKIGDNRFTVVIYDRKPDSALGMSARILFGGYLDQKRIRIVVTGEEEEGGAEVSVRGNVVMSEWNLVDDRPRRMDAARCERISEELVERLGIL